MTLFLCFFFVLFFLQVFLVYTTGRQFSKKVKSRFYPCSFHIYATVFWLYQDVVRSGRVKKSAFYVIYKPQRKCGVHFNFKRELFFKLFKLFKFLNSFLFGEIQATVTWESAQKYFYEMFKILEMAFPHLLIVSLKASFPKAITWGLWSASQKQVQIQQPLS